jgi:hypothetical protein
MNAFIVLVWCSHPQSDGRELTESKAGFGEGLPSVPARHMATVWGPEVSGLDWGPHMLVPRLQRGSALVEVQRGVQRFYGGNQCSMTARGSVGKIGEVRGI